MHMPDLETERLRIRPFVIDDLEAIHRLFVDIGWVNADQTESQQFERRRAYVRWNSINHVQLAGLGQPPYGDRAIVQQGTHKVIGACGLVPCLDNFGQLPFFGGRQDGYTTPEVGLMWAIAPAYQRRGYAAEAAQALIDFAFTSLRLKRIIATTSYDNTASQGVMRKVGMRMEKNPFPDPPWLQVVGILENK